MLFTFLLDNTLKGCKIKRYIKKNNKMSPSHPLSPNILFPSVYGSICVYLSGQGDFLEIGDSEILSGLGTAGAQRAQRDPKTVQGR